jgi:sec-independent protein translocase protein TatC
VVLVVFLCLMPFAAHIFDVLAAPMIHALPAGSKMIATGVITPFLMPIKVTMLVAVLISLALGAVPAVGLRRARPVCAREAPDRAAGDLVLAAVRGRRGVLLLLRLWRGLPFINNFAPKSVSVAPDIDSYLDFVLTMFVAFGVTFEVPVIVIVLVRMGWCRWPS